MLYLLKNLMKPNDCSLIISISTRHALGVNIWTTQAQPYESEYLKMPDALSSRVSISTTPNAPLRGGDHSKMLDTPSSGVSISTIPMRPYGGEHLKMPNVAFSGVSISTTPMCLSKGEYPKMSNASWGVWNSRAPSHPYGGECPKNAWCALIRGEHLNSTRRAPTGVSVWRYAMRSPW